MVSWFGIRLLLYEGGLAKITYSKVSSNFKAFLSSIEHIKVYNGTSKDIIVTLANSLTYSLCIGYSLCKILKLDQNFKLLKTVKMDSAIASLLEIFCAKNRPKKHQIFQK